MLSQRIQEAREMAADLSCRELAVLAGLSHSVISNVESGARVDMMARHLAAVARVLGVSMGYLYGDAERVRARDVRAAVERARRRYAKTKGGA